MWRRLIKESTVKEHNRIFSSRGTTIFAVMSALAQEHDAINLGQGFPDDEGPEDLRAAAARYVIDGPNQYPPMAGVPELRQAVAAHDKRFYGLDVEWQTETLVTSGATEALTASFMGLLNTGDEAVLIEPVYDSYRPIIEAMGATAVSVRLEPPAWSLPENDFAAAFSEKTKLIVVNSPMNPIGKVFSRDEFTFIAELVARHHCYVVCDEVYEHLIFDGHEHIPLMTLPGMGSCCVRIASAGKTFSLTGWKVGYVTARPDLLTAVAKAHQFITFTTPPALQLAVADGLAKDDSYYHELAALLARGRNRLTQGLRDIGLDVLPCDGTCFLTNDIRSLGFNGTDLEFCKHITKEAGVAAVPISAFYGDPRAAPQHFVRFCFCKPDTLLDEAVGRLQRHFA